MRDGLIMQVMWWRIYDPCHFGIQKTIARHDLWKCLWNVAAERNKGMVPNWKEKELLPQKINAVTEEGATDHVAGVGV